MAQLIEVEGANHMGPLERAALYNDAIARFALSVTPSVTADLGASETAFASQAEIYRPAAASAPATH